jgi:ubiquinone/menaquinone biosynthesis C-methylase UbiE
MLRRLVAPGLRSSQDVYAELLRARVNGRVEWLDLGCGHQVLPDWHAEEEKRLVETCKRVVGVDCDLRSLADHRTIHLRVSGDISHLPFKDDCFDLVTANMVVEHLQNPDLQFSEIGRILKTGGLCIVLTPNAFGYPTLLARSIPSAVKNRAIRLLEGRSAEDVFRTYYRANTHRRLKELSEANSLEIVSIAMVTTDALFAVLPPVVAVELLWIRILMTKPFRRLRPNILAVLRKRRMA